jgi:hypothetical protein
MRELRAIVGARRALGGFDRRYPTQPITAETTMPRSTPMGPRRKREDRRTHNRLRELCDEVLASFRVAQGEDVLSAQDRAEAEKVLKTLTPRVAR